MLKGIAQLDGTQKFSLYSTTDQTSKWVSVGQSFGNSRVLTFDPAREVLTIVEGTRRVELRIGASPIPVAQPGGEVPPGNRIRVSEGGMISAGTRSFSIEQLAALTAGLDKNSDVRIEMDEHAKAATGIFLLNAVRESGITRVTIATKTPR